VRKSCGALDKHQTISFYFTSIIFGIKHWEGIFYKMRKFEGRTYLAKKVMCIFVPMPNLGADCTQANF
jgi:hypothetical protein